MDIKIVALGGITALSIIAMALIAHTRNTAVFIPDNYSKTQNASQSASLTTQPPQTVTITHPLKGDYHIFLINEEGRQQYAIGSCDYFNHCKVFGYRWEKDQYDKAEAKWAEFAHPSTYEVQAIVK